MTDRIVTGMTERWPRQGARPFRNVETTNMEELVERRIKFIAGSPADPRPQGKIGCCLSCNRIVHYSPIVKAWVYDNGTFHTGHLIEVFQE